MSNWWYERWLDPNPDSFIKSEYMKQVWQNKAVYSREEVLLMVRRGEISELRADELLSLCFEDRGHGNGGN